MTQGRFLISSRDAREARNQAVVEFFNGLSQRVFLQRDLAVLLHQLREEWGLPESMTAPRFISLLVDHGQLRVLDIVPEAKDGKPAVALPQRKFTRYAWGEVSAYSVAQSLRPEAYLSHASAVFLHGLTEQVPKTIYVNKEQSVKPAPEGQLSQEAITRAFKAAPRVSNYAFVYDAYRFVMLSGKNTGRLEVSELEGPNKEIFLVTKLERTLIDIAVRPTYAGGVFEVLAAYSAARERLSFNTLLATLKQLAYIYPYHQAIGFYMERAGYNPARLGPLKELGLQWDFHLTNKVANPKYSQTWKLFYPEGL